MCRHRALRLLAVAALLSSVGCTNVLPWTADWRKPGAPEADKQAAIDRCHGSAIDNEVKLDSDAKSAGPNDRRMLDLDYTSRFSGCMRRLGWQR
jgi:hypothetical protein